MSKDKDWLNCLLLFNTVQYVSTVIEHCDGLFYCHIKLIVRKKFLLCVLTLFCLERKHLAYEYFLTFCFSRGGVVSASPNPQAGGPPLVGCPRLLIQYIRSYPPYRRPFLHPQTEDEPCRGDRDPQTRTEHTYTNKNFVGTKRSSKRCEATHDRQRERERERQQGNAATRGVRTG